MWRLFFCALVILFSSSLSGQITEYTIHIVDQAALEPLFQSYALVKGKNISALSDENGRLTIKAQSADTLVIYQSGYQLKRIRVTDLSRNNFRIGLTRKSISLEEVTVTSNKITRMREQDFTVFLDFQFYDDLILALINKGGKYNSLLVLDEFGNTQAELPLRVKSEKLFKDCLDNIQVITADSVYQVYYNYHTIRLLAGYPISDYYQNIAPCECQLGNSYIFKEVRYQNLRNTYWFYDARTSIYEQLVAVADSLSVRNFEMDFDIQYFLAIRRRGAGYAYRVSDLNKYIEKFREELALQDDYLSTLKPMESEFRKLGNQFLLFDYTHHQLSYFSHKGKLEKRVSLPDLKGIYPKVYIDPDNNTCVFTERNRNTGALKLYKYDSQTNALRQQFKLPDYTFVQNYKVKGNYLYFIAKIRERDDIKTKLVKVLIEWERI